MSRTSGGSSVCREQVNLILLQNMQVSVMIGRLDLEGHTAQPRSRLQFLISISTIEIGRRMMERTLQFGGAGKPGKVALQMSTCCLRIYSALLAQKMVE
jgi:hypothetical protein